MEFRRVLFRSLDRGARTLVGGAALPTLGESFHQPTVLVGVGPDALVNREETFGPLAAIIRFDTEAEAIRSEEHTSELQSLMRNSYAAFCLSKKANNTNTHITAHDRTRHTHTTT